MTEEQIRDFINNYIRKNGRKEITGDQMNYILTNLLDFILAEVAGAPDQNISNANLTLDQNRTFNFSGFEHRFNNVKGLQIQSDGILPGIGTAVFDIYGSGTGTDKGFTVRDVNGNILQENLDNGNWNLFTPGGLNYYNANPALEKVTLNELAVGNMGTDKQYALKVYGNFPNAGIAQFFNDAGAGIIQYRESAGSALVYYLTGASAIGVTMNAGAGYVEAKTKFRVNALDGITQTTANPTSITVTGGIITAMS